MTLREKLRKYSFLKRSYRTCRNLILTLNDAFKKRYYKIIGQPYIKSHYARVKNFGDLFNVDLLNYFGYKLVYESDYKKSQMSLTGSILQMYHKDYNGLVMGSGFIASHFKRNGTNWKIKIIRGPLSKEQCNWNGNCIYGDPGILVSLVFPATKEKKYKLGIVPHSADLEYVYSLGLPKSVKIINSRRQAKSVANEIQECEYIASSSLHGLIFADAYCIPNIHIVFGNRLIGEFHKFEDYYLGMESRHTFIHYDNELEVKKIINKSRLQFSKSYIEQKQKLLLSKFNEILSNAVN